MSREIRIKFDLKLNPKQELFFMSKARHIAYGGARGGGKSYAARMKGVMLCLEYRNLKVLLLRRTFPELRENHILPLQSMLVPQHLARWKEEEKTFKFDNGSRLKLGFCESESDVTQYQGQEYDVVFFEEATSFTPYQITFILTSNRSTRKDFRARAYYTCNPGGPSHHYIKKLFIDRNYEGKEKPEDYVFIAAKLTDNPYLMQNDDYENTLDALPEDLRRAHKDGDWDALSGNFFPEFRRSIHVTEPFKIPAEWKRYRVLDYGLDMLAAYWVAIDTYSNAYFYREVYKSNLIISAAADEIKRNTAPGEQIACTYAPPDLWNRRQDTGKSAFELFSSNGVTFVQAKNDRVNGWLAVKEWLKPIQIKDEQTGEDKIIARLKIFSDCRNLIRCLGVIQADKNDPNDCATEPHEVTHAPDALRYFCSMRVSPSIAVKSKPRDEFADFFSDNTKEGELTQSYITMGVER